jgi:hypothetical protein
MREPESQEERQSKLRLLAKGRREESHDESKVRSGKTPLISGQQKGRLCRRVRGKEGLGKGERKLAAQGCRRIIGETQSSLARSFFADKSGEASSRSHLTF